MVEAKLIGGRVLGGGFHVWQAVFATLTVVLVPRGCAHFARG